MKLANFSTKTIPKISVGIVLNDEIIDVDLAARALNIIPHKQILDLLDYYDSGMREIRPNFSGLGM